jgi:hypothetical protein
MHDQGGGHIDKAMFLISRAISLQRVNHFSVVAVPGNIVTIHND